MSVPAALEAARATLLQVAEQMGTRVTVERRPTPEHAAPVNADLTVDDAWVTVTPADRPAIVVVGGTNRVGLDVEGMPDAGEWAVTFPVPTTDVQPGDRLTVTASAEPRLLNRTALVSEALDTSAAVAVRVMARET